MAGPGLTASHISGPTAFPTPFDRVDSYVGFSDSTGVVADPISMRIIAVDWGTGAATDLVREGGGPGEIGSVSSVVSSPIGAATLDPRQRELLLIGGENELEEIRLDSLPLGLALRAVDEAGRFYFEWRGFRRAPSGASAPDSAYVLRWLAGGQADTLARLGVPAQLKLEVTLGGSRSTMYFDAPFTPRDYWALAPDGRLAVLRSGPRLLEIQHGLNVDIGPVVGLPAVPVGPADRDSAPIPQDLRGQVEWPDTLPPFVGALRWCQESELLLVPVPSANSTASMVLAMNEDRETAGLLALDPGERVIGCRRDQLFTAIPAVGEQETLRRRTMLPPASQGAQQ